MKVTLVVVSFPFLWKFCSTNASSAKWIHTAVKHTHHLSSLMWYFTMSIVCFLWNNLFCSSCWWQIQAIQVAAPYELFLNCFLTHTHERVNYGSRTGWKTQVSVSGVRQQTKFSTSETVMQMIYMPWRRVWEPHSSNKGGKPVPWGIRRMMKTDFVRQSTVQNWSVK